MYLFWSVWIIWLLSEVALNRLMHSKSDDKKDQDKGSIFFIWFMIAFSITLAVFLTHFGQFSICHTGALQYAGLGVIVADMVLRFVAIYSLGRFFTVDVTIRKDHKLKDNGLYGIIRHPAYSASLLSFLGFGLSLNNWLSLAAIALLMLISFLRRIKIEEKALLLQFGDEYRNYMQKTKRLIPLIY